MFLLVFIFAWIYPTFFSVLYLLKNRKKIQDVVEPKLQFSQLLFGSVLLIGTFQTEGFARDEMAVKCIGWNVWFAVGAGKLSWINILALITCEQITDRNKVWWWTIFIITNLIQMAFYIAVITSDTAHKTINDVCFLKHEYEVAAGIFIISECAVIACSCSIWQSGKRRVTMNLTCLCAAILFLPGVIHVREFMFERWWRILTILSNLAPIVFWHAQRTWYIAYLFAKHRSIPVWLSMKGKDDDDDDDKNSSEEYEFDSKSEEEEEEEVKDHFVFFLNSDEEGGDDDDIVDEYYHPNLNEFSNSFHLTIKKEGDAKPTKKKKKKKKFFPDRRKKKKN